jgi:hypothetical protein
LRRSSRRCDKFLKTRHEITTIYHFQCNWIIEPSPDVCIFQSLSHQLPWSNIKLCDLLKLPFFVVLARPRVLCLMIYGFCSVFASFVIILLDEEVRVLDHSNSCRVVEDFKLSIFSQNPK